MKKLVLALVFGAIGFTAGAYGYERYVKGKQVALYQFENIFEGGALMYRPRGTQGLAVFDLNNSTVSVQVFEKCAKITIFSPDGEIKTRCIPNALSKQAIEDTD